LITEYYYNSQDQITKYSHSGQGDVKTYRNIYDYAGRLQKVDYYTGSPDAPDPEYTNLTEYEFNQNSQISKQQYNDKNLENVFEYNNRSWITDMTSTKDIFIYSNNYFKNGNVKSQELSGGYNDNFTGASDLSFTYTYDRSNRLTETKSPDKTYELYNNYDKDGNILTLQRKGSTGNSIDDFNYSYYSGTNKLSKVAGSVNQYTYDANGNMTWDDLNKNFDIIYDYRNLIIQLKQMIIDIHGSRNDTTIYHTFYYYDEAGNRIRKKVYNDENDSLLKDIVYSRDLNGKEMAIYENGNIKQWNIWGLDNVGFILTEGDKRYYLKDHLGSVRAVLDESETVISSQDYDAWGYQLQDRNYDSDVSIYKFTSKERDDENKYDYFGARYYDARVGRWGSVDPIMETHFDNSPYNYVLDNPLYFIDSDGNDESPAIRPHDVSYTDYGTGFAFSAYQQTTLNKALKAIFSQVIAYTVSQLMEYFKPKSIYVIGEEGQLEILGDIIEEIKITSLESRSHQNENLTKYIGKTDKEIKDAFDKMKNTPKKDRDKKEYKDLQREMKARQMKQSGYKDKSKKEKDN